MLGSWRTSPTESLVPFGPSQKLLPDGVPSRRMPLACAALLITRGLLAVTLDRFAPRSVRAGAIQVRWPAWVLRRWDWSPCGPPSTSRRLRGRRITHPSSSPNSPSPGRCSPHSPTRATLPTQPAHPARSRGRHDQRHRGPERPGLNPRAPPRQLGSRSRDDERRVRACPTPSRDARVMSPGPGYPTTRADAHAWPDPVRVSRHLRALARRRCEPSPPGRSRTSRYQRRLGFR
jgi:hypothetical protein